MPIDRLRRLPRSSKTYVPRPPPFHRARVPRAQSDVLSMWAACFCWSFGSSGFGSLALAFLSRMEAANVCEETASLMRVSASIRSVGWY